MYLEHYGLTEPPFRITPHTDFFFAGAKRGATLGALAYAITHDEGIIEISGEVGSGKTMLCRVLMERLPEHVVIVYLANPSLAREDILYAIADELGIALPEVSRARTVMRALREKLVALYAEGKQVVVLIDEAHAMPAETLEEIRLLSNLESNRHKLLQLVLFGQPELDATLARADMRQLRERITHRFALEPLVRADIARYLDFRMHAAGYRGPSVFPPASVRRIAQVSAGLSRRINILADKALLAAFANGTHEVGPREIEAAVKDAGFAGLQSASRIRKLVPPLLWAGSGALAVLAGFAFLRLADGPATAQPAVATDPPSAPRIQPVTAPPPAQTPAAGLTLLEKKLAEGRAWIDAADGNRWFLQLYTASDARRSQLEKLLAELERQGVGLAQIRAYHSAASGSGRYGLIYGDYGSQAEAQRAMGELEPALRALGPYVRKTISLK